jgi:hypothetical protein
MKAIYFCSAGVTRQQAEMEAQTILEMFTDDRVDYGVVTSFEDVERYKDGSWDAWSEEVAVRRKVGFGKAGFLYDEYIFEEGQIGRATYCVLKALKEARRGVPIWVWSGGRLLPISKVATIDPDSWKDGWLVIGREPEGEE